MSLLTGDLVFHGRSAFEEFFLIDFKRNYGVRSTSDSGGMVYDVVEVAFKSVERRGNIGVETRFMIVLVKHP